MTGTRRKLAVVLFNLGGPDSLKAVEPFLFNLFYDRAIIRVPNPLRWCLARLISRRRRHEAQAIYAALGGASPLLGLTNEQADALAARLALEDEARCFIAMRYWHPTSAEAAAKVKAFGPDEIVLIPLYPQFSTTTTGSSLADWSLAAAEAGLDAPTKALCCYCTDHSFAEVQARFVRRTYDQALAEGGWRARVLFSAHGLPESIVRAGDPYQWQVERTVDAVVERLGIDDLDYVICYQSRVTPQKWVSPDTEAEVARAGREGVPIVVVPIAFVSEHSETLVELDIEYRRLAEKSGALGYWRVPALGSDEAFIDALAGLVRVVREREGTLSSHSGARRCPKPFGDCPHVREREAAD